MNFEEEIDKMPFHALVTEFNHNPEDYSVVRISFDCLKKILDVDIDERFPENNLKNDQRMANLQEFIQTGAKIIPPILRFLPDGRCMIFDGQHRVGLARYLKRKEIPFLVLKSQIAALLELNSECYQIC